VDALRLLEENHERYASILVRRASVNAAGECATVENAGCEVSNRDNDRHLRNRQREGPNIAFDRTASSHALSAAAQRRAVGRLLSWTEIE
jgi:hypothetical protein